MSKRFYVYCYYDPRKNPPEPFYIGKGTKNRYKAHLSEAKTDKNIQKYEKYEKYGKMVLNLL